MKTPRGAFDRYADSLKEALSCVADVIILSRGQWKNPGELVAFALEQNPVILGDSGYSLYFRQNIIVVPRRDAPDRWKISTRKYTYEIECAATQREVIGFHWERGQTDPVPYPHLHFSFTGDNGWAPIDRKAHVPSGRVAFEDVAYFAIKELRVRPLREDWKDVLTRNRQTFIEHKTSE